MKDQLRMSILGNRWQMPEQNSNGIWDNYSTEHSFCKV